jgi:hypothetical protein
MEDKLIELLKTLCGEVHQQGSLADVWPADFFTFWERPSYDGAHYDNNAVSCVYEYDINFYSTDPAKPYEYIRKAKKLLKENGFILSGNGYPVDSGVTTHTGRQIQASYLEREV